MLLRMDRMPDVAGWSARVDVGAAAARPSALSPKHVRNAFAECLEEHALRLIHETLVAQTTTAWGSAGVPCRPWDRAPSVAWAFRVGLPLRSVAVHYAWNSRAMRSHKNSP